MSETKLIVARHGNTFNKGDTILRIGSRTDLPLTQEGLLQGERLGKRLKVSGLAPDIFYSSPLLRTIETCQEIEKVFGQNCRPQLLDFLTELDYGEYDGLPEEEVVLRLGQIEANSRNIFQQTNQTSCLKQIGQNALQRWDHDMVLPIGWDFLQTRVNVLANAWNTFADRLLHENSGITCLVTTSNGIARFSLSLLQQKKQIPTSTKISPGAYSLFVWNGTKWKLESWNVH